MFDTGKRKMECAVVLLKSSLIYENPEGGECFETPEIKKVKFVDHARAEADAMYDGQSAQSDKIQSAATQNRRFINFFY